MVTRGGVRYFILYFSVFALAACTGPIEIPKLPGLPSAETDLAFHEKLEAEDVQKLFKSLNRTHKLDPLIPFIETPSPQTLAPMGSLISRHFYETVFSNEGFTTLLDRRAQNGDFSRWNRETDFMSPETQQTVKLLAALANGPDLLSLLNRDSNLLSANFAGAWDAAASAKFSLKYPESVSQVEKDQWTKDATKFLSDPKNAVAAKDLAATLSETEFAQAVLRTLRKASTRAGAFEGFSAGIARMITNRSASGETQLEKLLRFFDLAGEPTDGLFSVAQETLRREPHRIRELTNQLQGALPAAIRGFIRENLAESHAKGALALPLPERRAGTTPSPEWIQAFIAVRSAVENVTGPAADDTAQDSILKNLPIYLNTYILTRWLETASPVDPAAKEPLAERRFHNSYLSISLAAINAAGEFELDPNVKQDLDALGLVDFRKNLADVVKKDGFGFYLYEISEGEGPFKSLLTAAVDQCNQVRPFADGAAYLRAVAFGLTHEEGGFGFQLSDFETENLVDDVNQILAGVKIGTWRKLKRILFEDVKIGNFDPDTKLLIQSLYDSNPKLKKRMTALLDTVGMIEELDRPDKDLPSAFETYHQLLTLIPADDMKAVSAVFGFLSRTELVKNAGSTPKFPGVVQFLKQRSGLGGFFQSLAAVSPAKGDALVEGFGSALGVDDSGENGTEAHFALIARLLNDAPKGMDHLFAALNEKGWRVLPSLAEMPATERQFLRQFIDGGEFSTLWNFVRTHGEKGSLKRLTSLLKQLADSGYLSEAIDLLGHFKGERLQTLSKYLADWESTGELKALLGLLDGYVDKP